MGGRSTVGEYVSPSSSAVAAISAECDSSAWRFRERKSIPKVAPTATTSQ
jgi:hypothetical protein